MTIACKLVWAPKTEEESNKFWKDDFGPLLEENLQREAESTGRTVALDIEAFVTMWRQRGLCVIMAYDNGKPVGFAVGFIFRPVFFDCVNLHIERRMALTMDADQALLAYIKTCAPILGVDELYFAAPHEDFILYSEDDIPEEMYASAAYTLDTEQSYKMLRVKF